MSGAEILLVLMVLAFAWSIGAHYTGACMGMPYGSGSIRLWPALATMAVLAFLGALLLSHRVEVTVGLRIVDASQVTLVGAVVILVVAFALTTAYTSARVPTSTIQILVFSVAGTALGAGIVIHWATIARLAIIWILAPPVAAGLGYLLTRGLDRVIKEPPQAPGVGNLEAVRGTLGAWPVLLVLVGAAASLTMGGNDVANATGLLVMTGSFRACGRRAYSAASASSSACSCGGAPC